MFKASIHAGLRGATLNDWVIFDADVDYCEMSSKTSPAFLKNFEGAHPSAQE